MILLWKKLRVESQYHIIFKELKNARLIILQ